jgi:phosphoribosylamine--glycine ligase
MKTTINLEIDESDYDYGCIRRISGILKRKVISGLETVRDSIVFMPELLDNGNVVSNGGRVLAVTSYGNDFEEAIKILSKHRQATF